MMSKTEVHHSKINMEGNKMLLHPQN